MEPRDTPRIERYPMWARGKPQPASPTRRAAGARAYRLWRASLYEPRAELARGDDPWTGGNTWGR